ncbi:MAG: bifunctional enoyl-CoA hydratase/phosphate acetyltransferase [Filifactoraceae bacterium]
MEVKNFNELIAKLKAHTSSKKVAIAGAHDEHALEAVFMAEEEGLIDPIFVGDKVKILSIANELGRKIDESKIINEVTDEDCAKKAVKLVRDGQANVLMKGKLQTADLLRQVVNKEEGIGMGKNMSHVAILEVPGYKKLLGITDGGMIVYPDLEQKRDIVLNAVEIFHNLGYECPKVAALCAVETVNPKMQEAVDAGKLKEMNLENCVVEGPISYDLAMSHESAKIKGYTSPVIGDVDIFLMPNMATGNIVSKALIYSAGATMAGIVVGAKVPIVLTSRGATTEEKYLSIVLSAAASR